MSEARLFGTWPGEIVVCDTTADLYSRAAEIFVSTFAEAVERRGRATVALSGGGTPRGLYTLLAEPQWREKIEWNRLQVFWGDERFVPPTEQESNFRLANETLLSRVPIPAENVHRFRTESGTAAEVAAAYEREIRSTIPNQEIPAFDLNLLGIGTDAHTASLFPFSPALREENRLVISHYVEQLQAERLTFTVSLINHSRLTLFLVAGPEKAAILAEVLTGKHDSHRLPAQLVRPVGGRLVWLVDAAAGRRIWHISRAE